MQQTGAQYDTISRNELLTFMDERRRLFWLIGLTIRPCVHLFASYVEYRLYPPDTEDNDSFELLEVPWEDMMWSVLGLPMRDMVEVKSIAAACDLRIADGVPTMVGFKNGKDSKTVFPMNSRRCFTLENVPGVMYPPFTPHQQYRLLEAEKRLCERIWKGWMPTKQGLNKAVSAMYRNVRNARRA